MFSAVLLTERSTTMSTTMTGYCILGFRVRKLTVRLSPSKIYFLETIGDTLGSICEFFQQNVQIRPKFSHSLTVTEITPTYI